LKHDGRRSHMSVRLTGDLIEWHSGHQQQQHRNHLSR
jgi:hypothetical protein